MNTTEATKVWKMWILRADLASLWNFLNCSICSAVWAWLFEWTEEFFLGDELFYGDEFFLTGELSMIVIL